MNCTIFYNNGEIADFSDGIPYSSIAKAKAIMKKLYREGNQEIRMYADYDSGKRYYFKVKDDGSFYSEDNNFDN